MSADSTGFDPARDIRLDAQSLRGLAHPLRVQLMSQLRTYGPATASQLAQRLGQSSGATSYHLRQLAALGFVAEDTERGTRRERWWRSVHRSTRLDMTFDDETLTTGAEYLRAVARSYSDRMLGFTDAIETVSDDYGPAWASVFTLSDWPLELSAARARELRREIVELLARYQAQEPTRGARAFTVQVQLFPVADSP